MSDDKYWYSELSGKGHPLRWYSTSFEANAREHALTSYGDILIARKIGRSARWRKPNPLMFRIVGKGRRYSKHLPLSVRGLVDPTGMRPF